MRYSTPITVTLVSLLVHAFGLGAVLLLTTGVQNVPLLVLLLFFITCTLQPVIHVFTYAGIFLHGRTAWHDGNKDTWLTTVLDIEQRV